MDKYAIPDYVTSRVRYYNGQFLREDDFIDEQRYHIGQLRRHERLLHVSGVVDGLAVTPAGGASVTVSPGSAVDSNGRVIVLGAAQTLGVPGEGTYYVEIRFSEVETTPADMNSSIMSNTRFSLDGSPVALVTPSGRIPGAVTVAQLLSAAGTVSVVASSARVYSGVALPGPGGTSYSLRAKGDAAAGVAELGAGLSVIGDVTAANGTLSGALKAASATLTGALTVGGALSAGSAAVTSALTAGSLSVAGALSAASATVTNTLGAGSLSVTGALSAASASVSGALSAGSVSTTGALNAASLSATGALNAASATVTGALSAGSANIGGQVGVGTTAPKAKLHVVGDLALGADVNGQKFFLHSRSAYAGDYLLIAADQSNGSPDAASGISLKRNGNVGIGNFSPSARLDVSGDINYGRLTKLDVAESGAAIVRVADFNIGAANRRGTPGRALVDGGSELVLNYGPDWATARVGSPFTVEGSLTLTSPAANADLLLNSKNRPTVYPAGWATPPNLALQVRSAGTGELQLNYENAGNVVMAMGGGNVGVACAPAAKLHVVGLGPVGASIAGGTGNPGTPFNGAGWSVTNALEARASNTDPAPGVVFHHLGVLTAGIVAQSSPRGLRVTGPSTEARVGLYVDDVVVANRFTCGNTTLLSDYQTVNPSTNVFLHSQPGDRDAWIFRDQGDAGANWGIYHRQIDTPLGILPANSIAFVGASVLRSYISLQNGDAYFAGEVKVRGVGRAVACNEESLRTVRGVVSSNGTIAQGTGFTVARVNVGVYDITFSTPFNAPPTVVAAQMWPGDVTHAGYNTLDNAVIVGMSAAKVRIKVGDAAGNGSDRHFHFIAVGP